MGNKGFPEEFLRRFHPWSRGITPYSPAAPPLPSFKAGHLPIHCLPFHPHKVLSRGGRGAFQLLHLGPNNSIIVCCQAGNPLFCQSWLLEIDLRFAGSFKPAAFLHDHIDGQQSSSFCFPYQSFPITNPHLSLPLGVFDPPPPVTHYLKLNNCVKHPLAKIDACSSWFLCCTRSYFDDLSLTTFNLFC